MIKKLDKLILKSFIGPFIITFFIALFVLIMQSLWKYIDDLVGKGLDFVTIIKFVWYASATLLTLAMPIAILISSIMTFGNLGESFELVAIKSSGISLLRFMRPLMLFTVLLCFITFLFANYVIPYSQLKFVTLYRDILVKKPALNIKPGVFYTDINNYAIKVSSKDKDGKGIQNVLVYDQTNPLQENTIVAQSGKMELTPDNNYLAFNLNNGSRYQEKGNAGDTATEYIWLEYKTFKKLFDISNFKQNKGSDESFKDNQKMLSAKQLTYKIDSLKPVYDSVKNICKYNLVVALPYVNDTLKVWAKLAPINKKGIEPLYSDSISQLLNERALGKASEIKSNLQYYFADNEKRKDDLRNYKLEWQRKFAFSLACMVLFFIGAPLGSIIRKGGMGMPLVVAIVFFLIFHLLNVFGEKFVKNNTLSPFWGMWLAIIVLTPVGIFLTHKALNDSQVFNKEWYGSLLKKITHSFSQLLQTSPKKIKL